MMSSAYGCKAVNSAAPHTQDEDHAVHSAASNNTEEDVVHSTASTIATGEVVTEQSVTSKEANTGAAQTATATTTKSTDEWQTLHLHGGSTARKKEEDIKNTTNKPLLVWSPPALCSKGEVRFLDSTPRQWASTSGTTLDH